MEHFIYNPNDPKYDFNMNMFETNAWILSRQLPRDIIMNIKQRLSLDEAQTHLDERERGIAEQTMVDFREDLHTSSTIRELDASIRRARNELNHVLFENQRNASIGVFQNPEPAQKKFDELFDLREDLRRTVKFEQRRQIDLYREARNVKNENYKLNQRRRNFIADRRQNDFMDPLSA